MACVTEALGLSLPGTAAIPAVDAAKLRIARERGSGGWWIWSGEGIHPRDIVIERSIKNAIRVDMALGGSSNTRAPPDGHRPGGGGSPSNLRLSIPSPRRPCILPHAAREITDARAPSGGGNPRGLDARAAISTTPPTVSDARSRYRESRESHQPEVIHTTDVLPPLRRPQDPQEERLSRRRRHRAAVSKGCGVTCPARVFDGGSGRDEGDPQP